MLLKRIIDKIKTKSIPVDVYPIINENDGCYVGYMGKGDYQIFFKGCENTNYHICFNGVEDIEKYKADLLRSNNEEK